MKTKRFYLLSVVTLAFGFAPLVAGAQDDEKEQTQNAAERKQDKEASPDKVDEKPVVEFAEMYNKRFSGRKPRVGDAIPEADGFLSDGSPINLNETRGRYTVIVFGCLT